jgi:hypothetical protein
MVNWTKLSSEDVNLTKRNPWFSSFLVSSNLLSRKSWEEPYALEYRINWSMYTPYAGAAGMLLHVSGKFTMGNWNHLFCRNVSLLTAPYCQCWGVGQGMQETYLCLWYPLFQAQWDRTISPNLELSSERTSSIQEDVELKDRVSFFSFCRSPCMKSPSYE